jgi:hypothetical protein
MPSAVIPATSGIWIQSPIQSGPFPLRMAKDGEVTFPVKFALANAGGTFTLVRGMVLATKLLRPMPRALDQIVDSICMMRSLGT